MNHASIHSIQHNSNAKSRQHTIWANKETKNKQKTHTNKQTLKINSKSYSILTSNPSVYIINKTNHTLLRIFFGFLYLNDENEFHQSYF